MSLFPSSLYSPPIASRRLIALPHIIAHLLDQLFASYAIALGQTIVVLLLQFHAFFQKTLVLPAAVFVNAVVVDVNRRDRVVKCHWSVAVSATYAVGNLQIENVADLVIEIDVDHVELAGVGV